MHKCNQSPIISVKKREREYFQYKSSPQVTKYRFSHTRFSKISSHPKSVRSENNWKEVFENILFFEEKIHQMIYRSPDKTARTPKKVEKELQTSTVKYIPKFFPQAKSPKSQAQGIFTQSIQEYR